VDNEREGEHDEDEEENDDVDVSSIITKSFDAISKSFATYKFCIDTTNGSVINIFIFFLFPSFHRWILKPLFIKLNRYKCIFEL
jgi:hypothetical protein